MTERNLEYQEKELHAGSGMLALLLNLAAEAAAIAAFVFGITLMAKNEFYGGPGFGLGVALMIVGALFGFIVCPIFFCGLKVLRPNEALVLTLFGKYYGTLRGEGFFYVNPFVSAINPAAESSAGVTIAEDGSVTAGATASVGNKTGVKVSLPGRRISLKEMTLNNDRQKINDQLGNPVIIGTVVIWRVVNVAKAVFNVDNYVEFLSIQCDAALRNVVREYPYDISDSGEDNGDEKSLRGSSQEVADRIKAELQSRVEVAGIEIVEARITHLAYAPEIAAAMLQRQQASAIIAARQMIVDGAVGMVEMALARLAEDSVVELDEERKAQMVSNLLVVLCGNKDAQPIVNGGSIY